MRLDCSNVCCGATSCKNSIALTPMSAPAAQPIHAVVASTGPKAGSRPGSPSTESLHVSPVRNSHPPALRHTGRHRPDQAAGSDGRHLRIVFNLNVKSLWFITQALVPSAIEKKSGVIINVGPIAGGDDLFSREATVSTFTKGWAKELAPHGSRYTHGQTVEINGGMFMV
jgi:NAD(P)-dependent dehydrogenase (short-subunit alcohol dehydrogenase family)